MMFVWKSFHVFSHPDKRRTSQKHPTLHVGRSFSYAALSWASVGHLLAASCCLCLPVILHYFEDEKLSVCQHSCSWWSEFRRRIPVWSPSHISAKASRSDHLDLLPGVFIFIAPLAAARYNQIHTVSVWASCCHDPRKTTSCRLAARVWQARFPGWGAYGPA